MASLSLPAPRRFNVHEYHRMAEAGIFLPDERVELIEGIVVPTPKISPRHAACLTRMTRRFSNLLGDRAITWVRCPIRLDEFSEPEPDFGLLRARSSFYSDAFPGPADVLLLVEVAEATEAYDRRVKVPLYARAGIPEMWLVDLPRDRIVLRSRPSSGRYRVIRAYRRGEILRVAALPQVEVSVDEILG